MNKIILPEGIKTVKESLKTAKEKEVKQISARFMKNTLEGNEIGMDNYPIVEMEMNKDFEQYARGLIRLSITTEGSQKNHIFYIHEDAVMSLIFQANDSESQLASMIRDDKAKAMETLRQQAEREEFEKNIKK